MQRQLAVQKEICRDNLRYHIGASKPMRKGTSKIVNKPSTSKGKKYDKLYVYIPSQVAKDTNFPFKEGDKVVVEIKGKGLMVTEAEEE